LNEPGEALSIRGTITGSIDCRPIPGVTLDIWQTNAKGLYSNLFGFEDPSQPDTFNLRGRLMSDEHGHYQFESILPGRYPLLSPAGSGGGIGLVGPGSGDGSGTGVGDGGAGGSGSGGGGCGIGIELRQSFTSRHERGR
jgi:hypothetical protein